MVGADETTELCRHPFTTLLLSTTKVEINDWTCHRDWRQRWHIASASKNPLSFWRNFSFIWKYFFAASSSVTRFGEIPPLGQTFKTLWQILEGLFSLWQKFWTYFWQIHYTFWANLKKPNSEKNPVIWSHWGPPDISNAPSMNRTGRNKSWLLYFSFPLYFLCVSLHLIRDLSEDEREN